MDKEAILAFARNLGARAARDPLDARIERRGNTFVVVEDKVGLRLDEEATLARIWQQLPTGDRRVALVPQDVAPRLSGKDIEPVSSLAREIVSRPVVVSYGGKSWSAASEKLIELISFDTKVVDGKTTVSLSLDDTAFLPLADRIAKELNQKPQSAEFRVKGPKNEVVATRERQDGWTVRVEETARAIGEALLSGKHDLEPVVQVTPAPLRSADREKMDLSNVWMASSTNYAGSVSEKMHNIELAASRLDGIMVAPGEVFSFNEALGPTTLAAGFKTGWGIIMNGNAPETVPSEGGGICQVVTTLFHSVFWTGLKVEERWPHAYWIWKYGQPPRGMTGLDATVDSATVDFQFRNTTPNWIGIRSWTAGQQVYFQIRGADPGWTVKAEGPIITNVKKADPTVVRQHEPTFPEGKELQVESAVDGFDTKIVRTVFDKDGKQIDKLEVVSHYSPARNVILVGGPKETPTPTVTPSPPIATPAPGAPRTPAPQPAATPAGPAPQPTPKL